LVSFVALVVGMSGVVAAVPAQTALADTAAQIAAVKKDIHDADAKLAALETKAEQASERYNQARVQLGDVSHRLLLAEDKVTRDKAALALKQEQVDAFVVAAYQGGGVADITAFISGGSAQDTIDRLDSLGLVARNQDSALADLEIAKHAAADAEVEAQQILDEQKRVTARVAAEKAAIGATVTEQMALLDSLAAEQTHLFHKAKVEAEREAARLAAIALAKRKAALKAAAEALARQRAADAAQARADARAKAAADAANNNNGGGGGGGGGTDPSANGSNGAQIALKWAYRELGRPYVWGANGPNTFDCSGLTQYVWAKAGVYLPHYTGDQWNSGRHISRSELQPGDLVFYYSDLHHMAIYIGNGQVIHAPHTGDVVRIAPLDMDPYAGAVRVG
jgi:cell wall-associated NlpC family hydrolase